ASPEQRSGVPAAPPPAPTAPPTRAPGRTPTPVTAPIAAPEPAPIAPPVTARSPQVLPHAVALNRTVVIRISLIVCMVVSERGVCARRGARVTTASPAKVSPARHVGWWIGTR